MVSTKQRDKMVEIGNWLIDNHEHVDYAEVRPIPFLLGGNKGWNACKEAFARGEKLTTDCSGSITCIFNWSGLRDPNGQNYDGEGYTGDMEAHLPHYLPVSDAHHGTLLLFEVGPGPAHVTMVLDPNDGDPVLFSHGSQGGPFRTLYSQEKEYHPGQTVTLLDIQYL